jgi:hypothetical protein
MDYLKEIRRIKQQVRGTMVAPATVDAVDGILALIENLNERIELCSQIEKPARAVPEKSSVEELAGVKSTVGKSRKKKKAKGDA